MFDGTCPLGQTGRLTGWNFSIDFDIIGYLKQFANIFRSIDIRVIGCKFSIGALGFPGFWMAVIIPSTISLR